jgi:regulatory protein YycH of two-component signal transduction system YycFG
VENYVIPYNRFDRVLGMTFMEEDDKIIFSAIKKSQTDLYQFTIRGSRMKNITNDAWNDVQPWFVSGGFRRGVLFLSNRPEPNLNVPIAVNQLPTGPMHVYFYDTRTERPELLKCSNVTKGIVTQPIQYGSENFAFLNDSSGVMNKYVVMFTRDRNNMDSAYAVPVTNYAQSIIAHQYNPASNQVADVVQVGDKYRFYYKPLQFPGIDVEPKKLTPTTLSHSAREGVNLGPRKRSFLRSQEERSREAMYSSPNLEIPHLPKLLCHLRR